MFWNKKEIKKVNVQRAHLTILTTRDRPYAMVVEGMHVSGHKCKKAMTVLWEKITHSQYIKVTEDIYLNTDDICEVKLQRLEDHIIEITTSKRKNIVFIS